MQDGAALEAARESRGWLEQHKAQQDILWLEYMKLLRVTRGGYLAIGMLMALVHKGCTHME